MKINPGVCIARLLAASVLGLAMLTHSHLALAQRSNLVNISDPGQAESRDWVDVNADGKDDYCMLAGNQVELKCHLSLGDRLSPTPVVYAIGAAQGGLKWADVNGDGHVDVCRLLQVPLGSLPIATTSGTLRCHLGPTFTATISGTVPFFSASCPNPGGNRAVAGAARTVIAGRIQE